MKTKIFWKLSSVAASLFLVVLWAHRTAPKTQAQSTGCTDQALALAEGQLTDTIAYLNTTQFANNTDTANGNKWSPVGPATWTSGFFPGWMWFMYENSLNNSWLTRAQAQTASLLSQDTNASDHDIGFKILGSYGNGYRITRDPAYMNVIQTAARSMATLYRPGAGVIESWPNYDSHITVIIDNMMNLELLLFAAQNGGDPSWRDMAISHTVKTMQNHVRADGGTYHAVDYNADGTVFSKFTVQGAGNETTWSRGQAWGLYGFTMTYRYTQDPRFLDTAQRLADYFINNLPSDFVPYWDFSKCCTDPRDSSAASIAAAGLLELSSVAAPTDRDRYRTAALNIQSSLSSPAYLGDRLATDGILLHGNANVPANSQVNTSLIYGDYYFIQGCFRAKPLPPAPANLAANASSDTHVDLSWNAEPAPTRYNLKRSSALAGPYTILAPPVLTGNAFSDTGLTPGATYYYAVSAVNVAGESPDSAAVSVTLPNPAALPAISSFAPASVAAGTGFTLTVNGSNFVAGSVLNFGAKAEPTTIINATTLSATIPASDVNSGGTPAITISNPAPSGVSAAVTFVIDDFALSTPNSSVSLAARKSATISITIAPSDPHGFSSAVNLSVSGLPTGVSASFNPASVTPGTNAATAALTLVTSASATSLPGPFSPHTRDALPSPKWWPAALLLLLAVVLRLSRRLATAAARQSPFATRIAVSAPRAFPVTLALAAAVLGCVALSGCGGGSPAPTASSPAAPAKVSQLVVTGTSGTDTKSTTVSLSIQ
jgi:rhamnogalacturonyl hydrolase YesR